MSKNTFEINGNVVSITRPDWNFIAYATIRKDYVDEMQGQTWGLLDGRYPYCSKLGTLHSYIMKKWYGEEICTEMKEKGYVIDHIDNVSHNCCIENLSFLLKGYNIAKGHTFDQENEDKRYIALSIFKDFETQLFQITIVFNYPASLQIDGFDKSAVVEECYLLYEGDYRKVLIDAEAILLDYKENYSFNPEKLRMIDYHIEGRTGKAYPPEIHEEYLSGNHGHGVAYFHRRARLPKWTKETNEKYFIISDPIEKQYYRISL